MLSRETDSNYRTADPSLTSQPSSSGAHMSVAAKAGEMQIFSSDFLSQVNGLARRQTTNHVLRQGGKFSSNTNENRLSHIAEQMNNVEEKMLHIDADAVKPMAQTVDCHIPNGRSSEPQQTITTTIQSQQNERMPSIGAISTSLPRDSLPPPNKKLPSLQGQIQRLHPSQTFGEYMSNGSVHSRVTSTQMGPTVNTSTNMPSSTKQNLSEAPTMMGLTSNGHLSNSSSAIGKPLSRYSGQDGRALPINENPRQISPIIMSQISEKHLKIEVQSSQQRKRALVEPNNIEQTLTPTMMRRSIGSRSAVKQLDHISFLDKAAASNHNSQIEAGGFEVKNPGAVPSTVTVKKMQAAKLAQQQLLQNRYTNGSEPHMLPKMAGVSLERKAITSKQVGANFHNQPGSSLPPASSNSLSLIQQSHMRRRHGDASYGGMADSRMRLGIAGESLQIKLTGTSLMNNRNQQRDSYPTHTAKDLEIQTHQLQGPNSGVYHPKLRTRMPDFSAQQNNPHATALQNFNQFGQSQFAQQMADLQLNSPRNGNQIFQDNSQARVYSYHYIYDFLFVQVTEKQYEREYAHRIKTQQQCRYSDDDNQQTLPQSEMTPERAGSQGISKNLNDELQAAIDRESSPNSRIRGPPLKLNQNQVFFSPQVCRDSQGKIIDQGSQTLQPGDEAVTQRFRISQPDKYNGIMDTSMGGLASGSHSLENSDMHPSGRSKVVKMKRNSIRMTLQRAMQQTQYDGLKVLSKESILHASKERKDESEMPTFRKQSDDENSDEEATVAKFLSDVGQWLQEQNQRFKVTVKKKYINDILLQSKGAQNLAQHVVVVITNNSSVSLNQSPNKKVKRVKRNLSVGASSDEEEQDNEGRVNDRHETETQMRIQGQATPQVTAKKAKAAQLGRRGYESETEATKSFNSTTTSSTFPNLAKNGYATKQHNTPRNPRKMSTRSLSQIPNTVRVQRRVTEDINGQGASAHMSVAHEEALNSLGQRYQPTKIKIVQDVNKYNDHADHPINKMLTDYNEFTRLVFRTRSTEEAAIRNIPYAIRLGKRLGIQLSKNQLMPATLKVRENSNAIKEKLIFHICKVIRNENEFSAQIDESCSRFNKQISEHSVRSMEAINEQLDRVDYTKHQGFHYKCYIGKGNNQMMVRAIFKNRFWWLFHEKDEPEKVNFFWTQLRKVSIMNSLICKFVNLKDKNQQKALQQIAANTSPSQSLGFAIAQNSAIISANSANKLKKRKLSSAQSKSPEATATTSKSRTAVAIETTEANGPDQVRNIAMTLIGASKHNELTPAEETKIDIPAVTMAPPSEPKIVQSPVAAAKEEPKKESVAASNNNANANSNQRSKAFEIYPVKLANKIEDNYHLCNKKALFVNMKNYYEAIGEDPFDSLPVTFHIKEGLDDPNFQAFAQYYEDHQDSNNIWITKPGECTNRGVGIQVAKDWYELQSIITENTRSSRKTCIVQKYIHNPLLINRRKFDIRTYCMVTCSNGNFKAYYYTEGYLRTSCREFSLNNLSNRMVHLTNDAVQKKAEDYGKFEPGNKLSYAEFQNYIDKNHGGLNVCYERDILPQIKKLTTDCFRASWGKMDPHKRFNTFECYGLDFMIDEQFKVYLIEVNTNPCLELSSPLLARLIPSMLENAIRLAVDPVFPPPEHFSQRKHVVHELCPENKFELIFDERIDGPELTEIFREKDNVIIEIDEEELSDADIEANKQAPDGRDD